MCACSAELPTEHPPHPHPMGGFFFVTLTHQHQADCGAHTAQLTHVHMHVRSAILNEWLFTRSPAAALRQALGRRQPPHQTQERGSILSACSDCCGRATSKEQQAEALHLYITGFPDHIQFPDHVQSSVTQQHLPQQYHKQAPSNLQDAASNRVQLFLVHILPAHFHPARHIRQDMLPLCAASPIMPQGSSLTASLGKGEKGHLKQGKHPLGA